MYLQNKKSTLENIDFIKDIIEPINSKAIKLNGISKQLNITTVELKAYIKANGYVCRSGQYVKKGKITKRKLSEKVKVTYKIDHELQRLVKLQSIIEDTDNSTIIERAIENYISNEIKHLLKK